MTYLHGHYVGITLGLRLPPIYNIRTTFGWKMYIVKKMVLQIPAEGFF
jgi:hypothetical protein